jgi:sugar fermentation stimulation protein A
MEWNSLRWGTLVARRQRFFMDLDTPEGPITVHCANTGSMAGLLEPGAKVGWMPATQPGRKLPGSAEIMIGKDFCAMIHTLRANRIVAEWLEENRTALGVLDGSWQQEVSVGESVRLDFGRRHSMKDCWDYAEVKSVSWVENQIGIFPDAKSDRARKQLLRMETLLDQGHSVTLIYLMTRSDGKQMGRGLSRDPEYEVLVEKLIPKGLKIKLLGLKWTEMNRSRWRVDAVELF